MNKDYSLAGKRIVVTRAREQAGELIQKIEERGGEAVVCPVIRFVPPPDLTVLDGALRRLSTFDWIFFTSVNGVAFFFQRIQELGVSMEEFIGRIAAVGKRTAAALEARGLSVQHIPGKFTAEHLIETMHDKLKSGQKVLLPRSSIGREVLPRSLAALGVEVTDAPAYDTVKSEGSIAQLMNELKAKQIDIITFTSPSTVRYFLSGFSLAERQRYLEGVHIAVIGPITERAVREEGLQVHIVGNEYSIDGLIESMSNYTG
ncbi:uroporphyrinogen-III synthase [Aneurinibacillus aneurinilyticus]|jgi:uroporphyrinogen-III synthase|uniref:Uroporphyrinogen-III synthase n=2 Tax=Aneurinibacillus aneurinilyticus TaxID=1391 RepID=A0A848D0X7_ANEAE|nr:uroporphyrinogen-III synthase [Aneurinibacillus aneurinilyticus]ERI11565.1 uroporphyrinogen-III synthase [Aneurinibacillus aneurinilyticus ATCC 12856]MCI1693838.1 uroporphyrinogen-III synthase [Aneurinibacillus aneurinilyticus]MED0706160.1 uroporphyrinogen-III synthase [Aneurinibacillus aneurinilyticus]MED0724550.1 uroporphyrinogen-III synthase [Aneurinibacillus aneurinilyticus]MED0734954.1 uroporphyrinogen-III synthase [Aneurinibacillus aneurinilyticus]